MLLVYFGDCEDLLGTGRYIDRFVFTCVLHAKLHKGGVTAINDKCRGAEAKCS